MNYCLLICIVSIVPELLSLIIYLIIWACLRSDTTVPVNTTVVYINHCEHTAAQSTLATTLKPTTLSPLLNIQQVEKQSILTTILKQTTLSPGQLYTLKSPKRATKLSQNFAYLNNKCSVPFEDFPGWTVIQRRCNCQLDFRRTYFDYENGFGDERGEIWIGNEWLYNNTATSPLVLRVDFQASNGSQYYAIYNSFKVGSPFTHYRLKISGFSGNTYDALGYQNNLAFTTFDADHDTNDDRNCADDFGRGGFWFGDCSRTAPNSKYDSSDVTRVGIYWNHFTNIPFFQMRVNII